MKTTKFSLCLIILLLFGYRSQAQETFVNRVAQSATGNPVFNPVLNPFGVQWSKTISSLSGGIIMVGYTSVSGQGQNIYTVKYDGDGNIVFNVNYNTASSNNDYGLGVYEATNGDIYVCGATDNGGSSNYDIVVLRYNGGGTLLNSTTRNGPANGDDAAVSLLKDGSGNIIVAANTAASNGFSDVWVLKYSSSLSHISNNTYDKAGYNDFALGLSIGGGNIKIIGPSAANATSCDYVQINFNNNTLNFVSETRSSVSGTALDQALDFCKDVNDNTYITGKAWNGTDFDIKTIRINSNFTLDWSMTLNPHGNDDAGTTVIPDGNGNLIVAGYATKSGNVKEMIFIKYDLSTGSQIWTYNQGSTNPSGDAFVKQISVNTSSGDTYFVGGEKSLSGNNVVVAGRLNPSGLVVWERNIGENPALDYLPSDIKYDTSGIFVISIKDSVIDSYLLTKYDELTLDTARIFLNGVQAYKKNELLVSFHPSVINKNAVDNLVGASITEFENLSYFLTNDAYTAVTNKLESICRDCPIKAVKVFPNLKTTDTITLSRLNTNVPIPTFWSTFLIDFPSSVPIHKARYLLTDLTDIVSATQYNNFMSIATPPNDSLYSTQFNLHTSVTYPNAHINVEEAWTVAQDCGSSFVKGGVFDTGVEWKHKDFGFTGSLSSGKIDGYHFQSTPGLSTIAGGVNLRTTVVNIAPDAIGHGTKMAGLMGAVRNNVSGIAGVAGGDTINNNQGVKLYSLNTQMSNMFWTLQAMSESCLSGVTNSAPYRYGLHFSNHSYWQNPSYWPVDSFPLYEEQVHFANRMNITFIASRGNYGTSGEILPACYDTSWVISVGGTGSAGTYKVMSADENWWAPNYGRGIDIAAPTIGILNPTTENGLSYSSTNGTSASAALASGAVALLMSYMNNPSNTNDYMNLAPEDCDFILQRSATDVGATGYDSLTGYGRLNVGKALRMVEKPVRVLYHYGTSHNTPYLISKNLYAGLDTVRLTRKYTTPNQIVYNPGKYKVKTYEITAQVSHPWTYPTDSVMYHWARHSSSNVYDLPNAQKRLDLHERTKFVSFSSSGASLRGYIYEVWDATGTNHLGWWPCDTTFSVLNNLGFSLMEYSVLSKNKAVGIKENKKENNSLTVFPNPTNSTQTLEIRCEGDSDCKIDLFDLMGRHLKTVYRGKLYSGNNNIESNVSDLPNSMYIYVVQMNGKTVSRKFIKD